MYLLLFAFTLLIILAVIHESQNKAEKKITNNKRNLFLERVKRR